MLLPRLFCFYIYFLSAILKIPTRFFVCRGAVRVTHYSLSINRVGFFLSINREKIRLFPSDFMRTYFWCKQYFIHRKYIHVSTIYNGTGSDSKQSAYM